jgi:flavin reductase (DIM6/NTAB) family NADH-FMN oxidoreductase RutF
VYFSRAHLRDACGGIKKNQSQGSGKGVVFGMEYDLTEKDYDSAYALLASLICPRPIAWVTTLNDNGTINAAPFSFFNAVGDDPPMVMFCPGNRADGTPKDTARNIRRCGEFVINLIDESLAAPMVRTSASLPYGVSEVDAEDLEILPSSSISVPRIATAAAALECALHEILEIGHNRMVLGIVRRIHVREDFVDAATSRIKGYHPLGRMASPDWYCRTQDQFEIPRPR